MIKKMNKTVLLFYKNKKRKTPLIEVPNPRREEIEYYQKKGYTIVKEDKAMNQETPYYLLLRAILDPHYDYTKDLTRGDESEVEYPIPKAYLTKPRLVQVPHIKDHRVHYYHIYNRDTGHLIRMSQTKESIPTVSKEELHALLNNLPFKP